jgi:hypothetical protein
MKPFATRKSSDKSSARWALGVALLLSAPAALAACSSRSEAQQSGSACAADPPAYIDINLCSQLVDNQTTGRSIECATCCQNGSFSNYSFICNRHCTCGDPPSVSDSVTCATEVASSDVCSNCCVNSGYHQSTWNSTACTCLGLRDDDQICAATLDMPDPGQACPNCCINHGYLRVTYFALSRQCTCSG